MFWTQHHFVPILSVPLIFARSLGKGGGLPYGKDGYNCIRLRLLNTCKMASPDVVRSIRHQGLFIYPSSPSVRLSIRPSHADTASRRCKFESRDLHQRIAQGLQNKKFIQKFVHCNLSLHLVHLFPRCGKMTVTPPPRISHYYNINITRIETFSNTICDVSKQLLSLI